MSERVAPLSSSVLAEGSIEQVERVVAAIDALLADPRTTAAVQRFYDPAAQFAGDTFLSLAPTTPKPSALPTSSPSAFSPSTRVRPRSARSYRAGKLADQVSELLATIPTRTPLWDATDLDLTRASALWTLLKTTVGVRSTIAGKSWPANARNSSRSSTASSPTDWPARPAPTGPHSAASFRLPPYGRALPLQPDQPVLRVLDTMMWMHWRRRGLTSAPTPS